MDSGNSGSPQSSSAGDDDYDSRTAAAAAFINPGPHPPPRPSTMFDPFSNYTQQQWPGSGSASLRSDPHLHTLINPFAPSSFQQPPPPLPQVDGPDDNSKNTMNAGGTTAARNPRKRSRASRRAPTTVLTTDTNNFRAMVQEFTGIPAPPFSSPSFPRPHHNLFGRSTMDPARHPFAQTTSFLAPSMINYQQLPFPPHLHTSNTNNNNNNNNNNNILLSNIITNNNNNSSSNNQNPFFSSLLQTNPSKFTFSGSPIMASEPHDRAGPGPEEFGLGSLGMDHRLNVAAPNDLRSLIPSDKGPAREDHGRDVVKWGRNDGSNNNNKDIDNMGGDQVKPVNGGYEFTGLSCQGEKGSGSGSGPETTRVGDQGMVESWINNSSE